MPEARPLNLIREALKDRLANYQPLVEFEDQAGRATQFFFLDEDDDRKFPVKPTSEDSPGISIYPSGFDERWDSNVFKERGLLFSIQGLVASIDFFDTPRILDFYDETLNAIYSGTRKLGLPFVRQFRDVSATFPPWRDGGWFFQSFELTLAVEFQRLTQVT